MTRQLKKTSWESSASWYNELVGTQGHYYHQKVILPNLLKLMDCKGKKAKVLDLACGQGILSRVLPKQVAFTGVDLSKSMIQFAIEHAISPNHSFLVHDVTKKLPLPKKGFSHITTILALQNIEEPRLLLKNAHEHLQDKGTFFLVLNHPCFRIPRLSHWGFDEKKQLQYRRMDCYLSSQKIPIQMHPGKEFKQTWSFHHSLSKYSQMLKEAGFVILQIEEWVSDKKSTGKKARIENRSRKEFPLFLTLVCRKK